VLDLQIGATPGEAVLLDALEPVDVELLGPDL